VPSDGLNNQINVSSVNVLFFIGTDAVRH